jgi:hypothetical protein
MFNFKRLSCITVRLVGSFTAAISLAQPAWRQQPVQIQSVQLRSQAEPISPAPAPASLPLVEPDAFSLPELEQLALQANPSVNRMAALVGAARGN